MRATTKIIALAAGAVLALAPAASAHHGNGTHAKVYGAKLDGLGGKALLVDGSQNNALLVHVRDAKPSTAYTFELSTAPCGSAAVTDPAFGVVNATSNEAGNLNGKATSTSFDAADGTTYTVVVKEAGTAVACGQLNPLRKHHRGHKHHGRHQGRHDVRGQSAQSGDPGKQDCDHKS